MARRVTYGAEFTLSKNPSEELSDEDWVTDPREVEDIFRRFATITCKDAVFTEEEAFDHLNKNGVDIYSLPTVSRRRMLAELLTTALEYSREQAGKADTAATPRTANPILHIEFHPQTKQRVYGIVVPGLQPPEVMHPPKSPPLPAASLAPVEQPATDGEGYSA